MIRCLSAAAHAALLLQEIMFLTLLDILCESPPDWAACVPMRDETGERLTVKVDNATVRSTWQVMVAGMTFIWGWFASDIPDQHWRCVIPPLFAPNTQAASLWRTLTGHAWMMPLIQEQTRFDREDDHVLPVLGSS